MGLPHWSLLGLPPCSDGLLAGETGLRKSGCLTTQGGFLHLWVFWIGIDTSGCAVWRGTDTELGVWIILLLIIQRTLPGSWPSYWRCFDGLLPFLFCGRNPHEAAPLIYNVLTGLSLHSSSTFRPVGHHLVWHQPRHHSPTCLLACVFAKLDITDKDMIGYIKSRLFDSFVKEFCCDQRSS